MDNPKDINPKQLNDNKERDEKSIAAKIIDKIQIENPELLEGVADKEVLAETFMGILTEKVEVREEYEEHHQGPLPSPSTLQGYNNIIPNGAERIMTVFENQSKHRISIEKKVIGRQTFQSLFGQILGFVIALSCLGLGVFLVLKGHNAAGITLFSLDIVGLAYVFVIGKKQQARSLEENE